MNSEYEPESYSRRKGFRQRLRCLAAGLALEMLLSGVIACSSVKPVDLKKEAIEEHTQPAAKNAPNIKDDVQPDYTAKHDAAQNEIKDPRGRMEEVMSYYKEATETTIPSAHMNYDGNIVINPHGNIGEIRDKDYFMQRTGLLLAKITPVGNLCRQGQRCRDITFLVEDSNKNKMVEIGESVMVYSKTGSQDDVQRGVFAVDAAFLAYIDPSAALEKNFIEGTRLKYSYAFCIKSKMCQVKKPEDVYNKTPSEKITRDQLYDISDVLKKQEEGMAHKDYKREGKKNWCTKDTKHKVYCSLIVAGAVLAIGGGVYAAVAGSSGSGSSGGGSSGGGSSTGGGGVDGGEGPVTPGGGSHTGGGETN